MTEGQIQPASTSQASACIISTNMLFAKASHMIESNVKGQKCTFYLGLRGARQSHGQALHQRAVVWSSSLLTEVKGRKWTDAEFISRGCSLKWPQTWWLKTTEIYTVTYTEAKRSESGSLMGVMGLCYLQRLYWRILTLSNCWWLPGFLGLWPHHCSLQGQHLQISLLHHFPSCFIAKHPLSFFLRVA